MVIRHVFVVWSNPLFRDTVNALLTHPEIMLVGNSRSSTPSLTEFEHLRPGTVIVEETQENPAVGTEILQLLESSSWRLQVIRLSLQDNRLWLYQCEQEILEEGEDLLQLILV